MNVELNDKEFHVMQAISNGRNPKEIINHAIREFNTLDKIKIIIGGVYRKIEEVTGTEVSQVSALTYLLSIGVISLPLTDRDNQIDF